MSYVIRDAVPADLPAIRDIYNDAVLNTLAIAFMAWIWWRSPATGRTPLLFAITAGGAHFLVGFAHYLTWDVSSSTALRLFSIQQLLMLPLLILFYIFYAWKVSDTHV